MFKLEGNDNLMKEQLRDLCNSLAEGMGMPPLGPGKTTEIIKILDVNGDGEISFNEFAENIDKVNEFISKSENHEQPQEILGRLGLKQSGGGGLQKGSTFLSNLAKAQAIPDRTETPKKKEDTTSFQETVAIDYDKQ